MKRVLVTGATGFIGRCTLPVLAARGFEVHAVAHRSAEALDDTAVWHSVDLLDRATIAPLMKCVRPTHLLHLAWYAVPGKYWTADENYTWVQASLALLQEFQRHGGERVVMAGTCAEYDWRYGYCSEGVTPEAPATPYGTCKLALNMMLESYARSHALSSAWGRVFLLYGPRERPERLVPALITALLKDEPARCSHGSQVRDLLHVCDVAGAFAALLESDAQGRVNVASGRPVQLRDVVYLIGDILGKRDLIQLGAIPAAPHDPPLLCADVRRLCDEVGWTPQYDLKRGLEQTIDWWQRRHHSVETD